MGDEPLLVRAPGVLWRNTMRGVLISPDADAEPILCTAPGDVVWQLLAEPATRTELAAALGEIFDAEPDVIATDIEPVLAALLEAGALVEE